MTEPDKRVTYVCENCGSDIVTLDAWAEWDPEAQKWALGATFDYTFCHTCEEETHLREVPYVPSDDPAVELPA
jgi:hypothetical protein